MNMQSSGTETSGTLIMLNAQFTAISLINMGDMNFPKTSFMYHPMHIDGGQIVSLLDTSTLAHTNQLRAVHHSNSTHSDKILFLSSSDWTQQTTERGLRMRRSCLTIDSKTLAAAFILKLMIIGMVHCKYILCRHGT